MPASRLLLLLAPLGTPAAAAPPGGERPMPALLSALVERMPHWLFTPVAGLALWQWLGLALLLGVGLGASALLQRLSLKVAGRAARLTRGRWDDVVVESGEGPLKYALLSLLTASGSRALLLPPGPQEALDVLARSLGIVAMAWFGLRLLQRVCRLVEQLVAESSGVDVARARGVRTQLAILRHVLQGAIGVLAAALLLLQLETVRNIGMSLLASAGIAGLVLGLAAQKSISTLLAGIQLSITQPVRIGDTVIVEGEWGWVEEITLTYVVVKVWDLRRLVVPMTHFLEKPFQNWSKVSPDIMGTAELYVDYRADLAGLRAQLAQALEPERGGRWDGKVANVQVTGCSERTMTVRVLVSSPDAGKNFELRCLVRERLLTWLGGQAHGLPVVRAEPAGPQGQLVALTGGAAMGAAVAGERR